MTFKGPGSFYEAFFSWCRRQDSRKSERISLECDLQEAERARLGRGTP